MHSLKAIPIKRQGGKAKSIFMNGLKFLLRSLLVSKNQTIMNMFEFSL